MKRIVYSKLISWKKSKNRKPLIINGARQVGKTWLVKEFGKCEYENTAYINFDKNPDMQAVFSDFDTERLLRIFSVSSGVIIKPEKTLIILDEIQEAPKGLTSLKYFCEEAPEYHIIAAGSLLGIEIHKGTGFPVGKVDQISLYPLSFKEFLMALNKDLLVDDLEEHRWNEISVFNNLFTDLLRQYYYVGGMPAAVREYAESSDVIEVRRIQEQILDDYRRDFSKHVPDKILPKVNMVWDSIPSQLARENKKFIYSAVKKGGRAKEFESAIQWLSDMGLIYKIHRVSKVEKPLKFYEDQNSFKLFITDIGLLGALASTDARDVMVKSSVFSEYKGAFTEQFVLQELMSSGIKTYYHSRERSPLEIDFVIQKYNIYPIEVKAEENLKSKSLKRICEENISLKGIRISMSDYREQEWMINVPLYLSGEWLSSAK